MEKDTILISSQRLKFIRKLIDLAFTYGHNKELFYEKFMETVHIRTLKDM